jgi:photosystem II cytochrome c550
MVRTCLWLFLSVCLCLGWIAPAWAVELDAATRTVPLNDKGDVATLTLQEAQRGKRLFNAKCGTCHAGGITKTNPVVGLDPESLALATPPPEQH